MKTYALTTIALLSIGCGKIVDTPDTPDAAEITDAKVTIDAATIDAAIDDTLASLTLSVATLDQPLEPTFTPLQVGYTVKVSLIASEVRITPTAVDESVDIRVEGSIVLSGESVTIPLNLGTNEIRIEVNSTQTYTINMNRGGDVLQQHVYGKASNTGEGDHFGTSLSLSGNTLAVGAPLEDGDKTLGQQDSGAVYIFTRSETGWAQQALIKASIPDQNDNFGASVSLSGDTLVVGAPGEDSDTMGIGQAQSGNNAASGSGAVYVFTRNDTGLWSETTFIKASNTNLGDNFGRRVFLEGATLAVGAPFEDTTSTRSGAVYMFLLTSTGWVQQNMIKASNPDTLDGFGDSVSISGDTLAVGANGEDSFGVGVNSGAEANNTSTPNEGRSSGAVYVFGRSGVGATWSPQPQAYIKSPYTAAPGGLGRSLLFGTSVSLSDNKLAVGALLENGNNGAVYIYTRNATTWTEEAHITPDLVEGDDHFGQTVSLDGDVLAVGAPTEDSNSTGINSDQANNNADFSGAAYLFKSNGATWTQETYIKASNTDSRDNFGIGLCLSADTLVISAELEDSSATGINNAQTLNTSPPNNSGAFYVFQ